MIGEVASLHRVSAHGDKFGAALAENKVLAPAKTMDQMAQIVGNDHLDAFLALFFMGVVVVMLVYAFIACRKALATPEITARAAKLLAQAKAKATPK